MMQFNAMWHALYSISLYVVFVFFVGVDLDAGHGCGCMSRLGKLGCVNGNKVGIGRLRIRMSVVFVYASTSR